MQKTSNERRNEPAGWMASITRKDLSSYLPLFVVSTVLVFTAWSLSRCWKPQLKTIYDLEKGRYITKRILKRWFFLAGNSLCFWDSLNLYQLFQFISLLFLCCLTHRFASVQCICVMEENSNWGTQRMAHCVIILQFYIYWKLVWNKNNLFKASEFCWCCRWSASSCDELVQIWSVIWVLSM